jgi:hypothetical protein
MSSDRPTIDLRRVVNVQYKWVVLSNTTLGVLMASIDITAAAASALRGKRFVYSIEQEAVAVKVPELTEALAPTSPEKLQSRKKPS